MAIIKVDGKGTVKAQPDYALFTVQVQTLGRSSAEVRKSANELTNTVRQTLAEFVKSDLTVRPPIVNAQYEYTENNKRELQGYIAWNEISGRLENLEALSQMVDKINNLSTDEVQLGNLSFGVSTQDGLISKARTMAYMDAKDRAVHYALQAHLSLGSLESLEEQRVSVGSRNSKGGVYQLVSCSMNAAPSGAPQVELSAGDFEITVEVEAVFNTKD